MYTIFTEYYYRRWDKVFIKFPSDQSVWVDLVKINGQWLWQPGGLVQDPQTGWLDGEPDSIDSCASLHSDGLIGYMCSTGIRPYLCYVSRPWWCHLHSKVVHQLARFILLCFISSVVARGVSLAAVMEFRLFIPTKCRGTTKLWCCS